MKLADNFLSTIDSAKDFASVPNLGSLTLRNNTFEEIPFINNLNSTLAFLDLSLNRIRSVNPAPLQLLGRLFQITLTANFLTSFPDFYHPRLLYIYVANNAFTSIPKLPLLYKQIKLIDLASNQIQLDVSTFASFSKLATLLVSYNSLITIPKFCAGTPRGSNFVLQGKGNN